MTVERGCWVRGTQPNQVYIYGVDVFLGLSCAFPKRKRRGMPLLSLDILLEECHKPTPKQYSPSGSSDVDFSWFFTLYRELAVRPKGTYIAPLAKPQRVFLAILQLAERFADEECKHVTLFEEMIISVQGRHRHRSKGKPHCETATQSKTNGRLRSGDSKGRRAGHGARGAHEACK